MLVLNKKCGGIRPIAVGLTLRRLASKCANSAVLTCLGPDFAPRRLGLGTPGSCEAAKHSTVRFLESFVPDHVVRKLDFSYAFNSIHRRDMLQAVFDRIPELFAFASSAYSVTSIYCFTPLSGCFHKRALSKATHWARFCFATRFSRYFYLWLTN